MVARAGENGMNREEYDTIIYNEFMPFVHSDTSYVWEHCESYIRTLEQRISELELRLSLSDSALDEYKQQVASLEAQEIMIADYKKRIEELEAPQICGDCLNFRMEEDGYGMCFLSCEDNLHKTQDCVLRCGFEPKDEQ